MLGIEALLARADTLAAKTGRSEATVSKWLFKDANAIQRLRSGESSCTIRTLTRAYDELRRREIDLDRMAGAA